MGNLETLVVFAAKTASTLENTLKDGFQTKDLLPIGMQLMQFPDVSVMLPLAKEEFANRTEEDLAKIKKAFADNFEISNESLEQKIEKLFEWVATTADLIALFVSKGEQTEQA